MHTKGPWIFEEYENMIVGRSVRVVSADSTVICDDEPYYPCAVEPNNARFIAAACTSYDKHCGERAVEAAEADLLGQALEALRDARCWVYVKEDHKTLAKIDAILALAKGEK